MDIFIAHKMFEDLRRYWHKECESCVKEEDADIVMCPVHHNMLMDCYKWKMKILAEKGFGERVREEKKLIESISKKNFSEFWRNNRDKFSVYNMFVLENHEKYKTKDDILKLYNTLLKEHKKEMK